MKETEAAGFPLVAVAIDGGKSSMNALKWAVKNLIRRGQTIILVHVNTNLSSSPSSPSSSERIQDDSGPRFIAPSEPVMKELFLPFRAFCTRKDVQCMDILLEDTHIAMAIAEFVINAAIEKLVVGDPSLGGFVRFKANDISSCITKAVPDFCTVYVISDCKVSSMRNAIRPAPSISPLRSQIQMSQGSIKQETYIHQHRLTSCKVTRLGKNSLHDEQIKWPPATMKETEAAGFPPVAVAIDADKSSQNALKWAVENLITRGQAITLVHVNTNSSSSSPSRIQDDASPRFRVPSEPEMKELFLPFHVFCIRKDVQFKDILLEDTDIAKAIIEFVSNAAIEKLVFGAPSRGGFFRKFKSSDISSRVAKGVPDFCTVHVILKSNRKVYSTGVCGLLITVIAICGIILIEHQEKK